MSYNPNDILGGGAWSFIEGVTISNQASVEFVLTGSFKMYQVHMTNIVPVTDDIRLDLRLSTDGGSTFFSGGTDYDYRLLGINNTSNTSASDPSAAEIGLGPVPAGQKMGTGATECLNGSVYVHNPGQAAKATCLGFEIAMVGANGTTSSFYGGGRNDNAGLGAVDALQFRAFSGNLSSGRMELYGLKLS